MSSLDYAKINDDEKPCRYFAILHLTRLCFHCCCVDLKTIKYPDRIIIYVGYKDKENASDCKRLIVDRGCKISQLFDALQCNMKGKGVYKSGVRIPADWTFYQAGIVDGDNLEIEEFITFFPIKK